MTNNQRLAVCVCIFKGEKLLAVARRGTIDAWGLPGGKVDPGEDPIDALVREVWEETHIKIDKTKLKPVFQRIDDSFIVITYLYLGAFDGQPEQGDAGSVDWVTWDQLLSGPFGKYNARLKETLDRL